MQELLRELYKQRFLGYRYYNDAPPIASELNLLNISSNLQEFASLIANCSLCNLSKNRECVTFGKGGSFAKVMFVGDIPNINADEVVNLMVKNVLEIDINDAYITNIIKCQPNPNILPSHDDFVKCKPFIMKQIEILNPKIIIALGAKSYSYLTGDMDVNMNNIRGEVVQFGNSKLMGTFHPSFIKANPSKKRVVLDDMLKVKALL